MNNRQNENRSCFVDTVLFIAILACVCGFLISEREVRASEPTETTSSTSETGNGTSNESSNENTESESSSSTSSTSSTASSSSSPSSSSSSSGSSSTSSSSSSVSTNVIHWNVTYTPIIKVNGIEDRTKSVSQYNYQVINNSGSAVSAVIPANNNNSPISGEITITGTLDSKYKIKLIGVVVDGNSYTPASDDTTSAYDPSTLTITGTLSPVINTTTRPSGYGNKLKATKVDNEDDDYLEVSKIDDDLRNDILDYVYDNNVNNLKPVIQGIMSRGNELSLKVVAEKIDSSDADGKSDIKDEAKPPEGHTAEKLNYYNISVYITEGSSYRYDRSWNVTDTGSSNKLKLKFKVKSGSSSTSGKRYYKVIRYHDGDADSLTDYTTTTPIETKSHKFSTYAVYYYDDGSKSTGGGAANNTSASLPPQGNDPGASAGGTDKSKTPKTGDDFNPRIWIYLLIVCATVASAAWILLQDTRDDSEKKQN